MAVALGELVDWIEGFGVIALPDDPTERREKVGRIAGRYAENLSDLPSDLLVQAIRSTINAHRFRNLPLPADIRATVAEELGRRRAQRARLESVLRLGQFERPPVPRGERVTPEQLAELRVKLAAAGIPPLPGSSQPEVGEPPTPLGADARRDRYADA